MSSFGGFGIFPVEFGSNPSEQQKVFRVLADAVGEGGSAADTLDVTTLDGAWRAAKAKGVAAAILTERAAHFQGFPSTASDELTTYENTLGYVPPPEWTEEDRRQEATRRWTTPARGDLRTLDLELKRIDARFQILEPIESEEGGTIPGRTYDAVDQADGTGTFGFGKIGTNYPAFSDAYLIAALINVPTTPAEGDYLGLMRSAEELLARRIPAWCDFEVGFSDEGIDLQIDDLPGGDYLSAGLFGSVTLDD